MSSPSAAPSPLPTPKTADVPDAEAARRGLYRETTQAAWLGLAVNAVLGATKLYAGWTTGLVAITADAVNSLGDVLTSSVVVGALYYAQQPPDEEHPYGHTRAEAVAASHVALLVMIAALGVGWEAFSEFFQPHHVPPPWWTLALAGTNAAVKEALYHYKKRVAERTGSLAVLAHAWDHRGDALSSLAVLVGLLVVRSGGSSFGWADEAAAVVVVAIVLRTAGGLFLRAANELLDVQADPEIVDHVRRLASAVPGVRAVEKLRVRKSGIEYLVDVHVQVDPRLTVDEGHRIGHAVKDRLVAEVSKVLDVLVHLEPHRPSRTNAPPTLVPPPDVPADPEAGRR